MRLRQSLTGCKWIRGGRIITGTDDFIGEIFIGNGQILAIGKDLEPLANSLASIETIDAQGLLVFPGAIDVHTHLDLPFMGTSSSDDFESGTRAAIYGGTTSIIDFAIQEPGQLLGDALQIWHEKADRKSLTDYSFHLGVTDYNDRVAAEIPNLIEKGITSFKCFMAYKGSLMVDDGQIFRLLTQLKELGGLVTAHCENADLIDCLSKKFLQQEKKSPLYHELSHPAIGEAEATHRFIALSRIAQYPIYIVHLTCSEALDQVKTSITKHLHPVFAETCPQYLLLDRSVYERPDFEGAKWVMSPPIRTPSDQEALWAGIRDGFIQTIATDHCPFHFHGQKDLGLENFTRIPNGAPGIENRFDLIYTYGVLQNRISLNRFVQVMCTQPAKIFGMYPQKGSLAPGADADVILFDPSREKIITAQKSNHRCDYSAFEGFKVQGETVSVLIRGEWALRDRELIAQKGMGKFIPRTKFQYDRLLHDLKK